MSGFLQRIAGNALLPQASAQPFVESIYPVARRQGSSEPAGPVGRYESFADSGEQLTEHILCSELSMETGRRIGKALTSPAGERREQQEPIAERDSFEPLLPRPAAGPTSASKRARLSAEEDLSLTPRALRQDNAKSRMAFEYVPLVADYFASDDTHDSGNSSQWHALGEAESVAARAKEGEHSEQKQSGARPTSPHAEDIQIHIGRIEVVAVPQAAPRPVAAPTRKGLSLDEYLRRRNGRVG